MSHPHVHGPDCHQPCNRQEDLPEGKSVTEILELKDFQAELRRRNRTLRASDKRWWVKLAIKAGMQLITGFGLLMAIGLLSLANHCGVKLPGMP